MSETKIQDGTGSGGLARVGPDNRLYTSSEAFPAENIYAIEGNGYVFHSECHLAAASSGGLMAIKNTSSTQYISITRIYFDAHVLTEDVKICQLLDSTISNGTDISSTGIVQKNRVKAKGIQATLTTSDASSDMTYSGGDQVQAFSLASKQSRVRNMEGTIILGPQDLLVLGWETLSGSNATDGETIGISVNCYTYLPSFFSGAS